jgi:hydrogenase small subunit
MGFMSKENSEKNTIAAHLKSLGVSRRDFLQMCGTIMAAAPVGLMLTKTNSLAQVAAKVGKAKRPSVIWLHFQDCTGCTETLLRTSRPDVGLR